MWNLISVNLELVLVSVQYMCTVCAECTILSKIVLDAPDDTPGFEAKVQACWSRYGDSANLDAR
jgi:hypothetical protein